MSRTQPLTVVLVDDHIVVRSGLRVLLESEPSIEVVAEAGDVPTAVVAVAEHSPDVIVLDLHMPGEPSLPAIPRLRESSPAHPRGRAHGPARPELRGGGAAPRGVGLRAEGGGREPAAPGDRGGRGGRHLPRAPARRPAGRERRRDGPRRGGADRARDRGAAADRARPDQPRDGHRLYLSVRTVESHRARIQRKLGRSRRSDLVEYALERGLVEASDVPT